MRQTAKTGAGMQKTGNTAELARPCQSGEKNFQLFLQTALKFRRALP
jgi:hypothetical protein